MTYRHILFSCVKYFFILIAAVLTTVLFATSVYAQEGAPNPTWYSDSYFDRDEGKCYCDSSYDHDVDTMTYDTPIGRMLIPDICAKLGDSADADNRQYYNDIQCGNGPANTAADERICPGTPHDGNPFANGPGCDDKGPLWDLSVLTSSNQNDERQVSQDRDEEEGSSALSVAGFDLYDAATDEKISSISSGMTINLGDTNGDITIVARTSPQAVGSVLFEVNGQIFRTEATFPYAIEGDNNGDLVSWDASPGEYTITATPYSATNAQGIKGVKRTISFTVSEGGSNSGGQNTGTTDGGNTNDGGSGSVNTGTASGSFRLWNASTNQVIGNLGSSISSGQYGIEYLAPGGTGSVKFSGFTSRTENISPYMSHGDNVSGDIWPWNAFSGTYTIKAQAYSGGNGTGSKVGPEASHTFTVGDGGGGSGGGSGTFRVWDSATDQIIGSLGSSVPNGNVGIEFIPPAGTSSVRFSGAASRTENISPFMSGGDNTSGDIWPGNFGSGTQTLTAQAYSGKNGSGQLLTTETVTFTIGGTNGGSGGTGGTGGSGGTGPTGGGAGSNSTVFSDLPQVEIVTASGGNVNVRIAPNGIASSQGPQPTGATGRVVSRSNNGAQAGNYAWWYVDFDTGADGYVAEPFLRRVGGDGGSTGGGGTSGSGSFLEEGKGYVVFETESTQPTDQWQLKSSANGFTGTGYLSWQGSDLLGAGQQGILNYPINIQTPGTYYVRIHNNKDGAGHELDAANDVSVRVIGANGGLVQNWVKAFARPYNEGGFRNDFWVTTPGTGWNFHMTFEPGDHVFEENKITFNSPGEYVFQISARSTDFIVDRVVLYQEDVDFANQDTQTLAQTLKNLPVSNRSGDSGGGGSDGGNNGSGTGANPLGYRIGFSTDGNNHDRDDIGAVPITMALLAYEGAQAAVTHWDYASHYWENNEGRGDHGDITTSIREGARRFGINDNILFDDTDPNQRQAAINSIAREVNRSSANDRFIFIAGGPMSVVYQGLAAADSSKYQHVLVVSHSQWNNEHADGGSGRTWSDIQALGVPTVKIRDQNEFLKSPDNDWSDWQWLKNHSDQDLRWVYERMQLVWFAQNDFSGQADVSDSGMLWYVLNNNDETANPSKYEQFFRQQRPSGGAGDNGSGDDDQGDGGDNDGDNNLPECGNGIDDDNDGLVDTNDPDCQNSASEFPVSGPPPGGGGGGSGGGGSCFGPCGGDTPTMVTTTIDFPSGTRTHQVPSIQDSFGTEPVPQDNSFLDSWSPSLPGECSSDIHDRYWVRAQDGHVYRTWHPPRDIVTGCTFGHEHGNDPRESPLYYWAGGVPFGLANRVAVANGFNRHEDHPGHKVLVQDQYETAVGNSANDGGIQPTGFHCYWLSKVHQGTHSPDAFANNMHEYHNNVMCDDGAARNPNGGFSTNTGRNHHTETSVKTMAFWGQPGWFKACKEYRRVDIGNPGDHGIEPPAVDTNREIKCARRDEGWPWKEFPRQTVGSTGHTNFEPKQGGIEEIWKPGSMVTSREGKRIFFSSAYYGVLNPSRLYNEGTDVPRRDMDGDGQVDNWIPTIEFCKVFGQGQCSGTPNVDWRSPESPWNGTIRFVHPKRVDVDNQTSRKEFCTNHIGQETGDSPQNDQYGIPRCPEGQIFQRVAATQNLWWGGASWKNGASGNIEATMINHRGGGSQASGIRHEWVRFFAPPGNPDRIHAPN